jgi:hypothetical protein
MCIYNLSTVPLLVLCTWLPLLCLLLLWLPLLLPFALLLIPAGAWKANMDVCAWLGLQLAAPTAEACQVQTSHMST